MYESPLTQQEQDFLYDVRRLSLPEREVIFATARALREAHEVDQSPMLLPAGVVAIRRVM